MIIITAPTLLFNKDEVAELTGVQSNSIMRSTNRRPEEVGWLLFPNKTKSVSVYSAADVGKLLYLKTKYKLIKMDYEKLFWDHIDTLEKTELVKEILNFKKKYL